MKKKSISPPLPAKQRNIGTQKIPIVVLGGSAGSIEVFQFIFSKLPANTGLTFVVILHLDPDRQSKVVEILSRSTEMATSGIIDGMQLKPNHIYVIPSEHNISITNKVLHLTPRISDHKPNKPLDEFLFALSQEKKCKSVAVILSGTGSDGMEGIRALKAKKGMILVQEPSSAHFDEMPRSAVATGVADFILTSGEIVEKLVEISKAQSFSKIKSKRLNHDLEHEFSPMNEGLSLIFSLLQKSGKVDFSRYKQSTIQRRIRRRMNLVKIPNLAKYATYLQNEPSEVDALFAEILIHVTEFFRDSKAFELLGTRYLPKYMKKRDPKLPFRVWVAGCSTGEEAYSIAMILMDYFSENDIHIPLTLFATDLSEEALQKCRNAIYPKAIVKNLSKERLHRYFDQVEGGYRIVKSVRETCLFSRHDITRDPPFAKVDLISCRNLLIYFNSALQKQVIPVFHYALNPNGLLLLGSAETVNGFTNLFSPLDKSNKIYSKKTTMSKYNIRFPISHFPVEKLGFGHKINQDPDLPSRIDIQKESERVAILQYVPPSVTINDRLEIIQIQGRTAPFLELAPGYPSLNLIRIAHPELITDLRNAIQSARKKGTPVVKNDLYIHDEDVIKKLSIRVVPLALTPSPKENYFTIFFEKDPDSQKLIKVKGKKASLNSPQEKTSSSKQLTYQEKQHSEIQKRLKANLEYQRSLIEQYEITQDKLVSSNEELQSMNEELQSSNEELETTKEELQSTNEELITVNDELQNRNIEIGQLNNDLTHLLTSIDMPIMMVGPDRKIRRFTPKAAQLFNLIQCDTDRHICEMLPNIHIPNLPDLISEVISKASIKEIELQDKQGRWYQLQIRPYRAIENKIDGAVIFLHDIDTLKRTSENLKRAALAIDKAHRKAREDAETIIQSQPIPLLVLDSEKRVKLANKAFCQKFQLSSKETEGKLVSQLDQGQWNIPMLLKKLEETLTLTTPFSEFEVKYQFSNLGWRNMLLNASRVRLAGSDEFATLLAIEDRTNEKKIEQERSRLLKREQNARAEAEKANRMKDEFLAILSHELRTPLTTILSWAQLLKRGKLDSEKTRRGIEILEESAKAQGQLIEDLLDVSRIQANKLKIEIQRVNPNQAISNAIDSVRNLAIAKSIEIVTQLDPTAILIDADPTRLQQILWNLLNNSIKFSSQNKKIYVQSSFLQSKVNPFLQIQVRDQGEGIKPEFLPVIFDRFSQADSSTTRSYGGLGLGLAIVKKLVEMHRGTIEVESQGIGCGATFTISFPVPSETTSTQEETKTLSDEISQNILTGLSILLIEDEKSSREALSLTLRSYGAKVYSAQSVSQGLSELENIQPDIIVSDIGMPGEDGFSLIQKIRSLNSDLSQTPTIALTAYAGEENIRHTLQAGFQTHLAKPVDTKKLILTIRQFCK